MVMVYEGANGRGHRVCSDMWVWSLFLYKHMNVGISIWPCGCGHCIQVQMGVVTECAAYWGCSQAFCKSLRLHLVRAFVQTYECKHNCFLGVWAWPLFLQVHMGVVIECIAT